MIFYVLLGVFLLAGARGLVWPAYGDAPGGSREPDTAPDATEPSR